MADLQYVPREEFDRVRRLSAPPSVVAAIFATMCRINVLYMVARAGSGHIGTSFSSLDIMSWLYLNELNLDAAHGSEDVFFSSKGHDVPAKYAVLLALGLLDFNLLHALRRLGGLPGHPDVATPHIPTNTGSLGMGVSKARGMALARRLQRRSGRFFVLTGDGELQEGQFWESLQPTSNRGLSELVVIVDQNKLQSDTFVERVSALGDLAGKFAAFGWHVERCDGHDMQALQQGFKALADVRDRPKLLIADTVKGKGVSFMEHTAMPHAQRLYTFHSGAPDDAAYAAGARELIADANRQLAAVGALPLTLAPVPRPDRASVDGFQRLIPAYSQALVSLAERRPELVALDADLALDTGLIPFEERFPDRFFECGIAEQDMVSQAGGMALEGLLPVVHSFACFLSDRPNEQIYNNATERTKIVYVGSLAGLLPGGPGHSHQSVRDIAALSGVPGLTLVEPSCEAEVPLLLNYCFDSLPESIYVRLVSIPCDVPYELPSDYRVDVGHGAVLVDGADAALISYGPVMLAESFRAAGILRESGIHVRVVNLPWLNRIDLDWLNETVRGVPWIFTVDNHYVEGGQGELIAARLAGLGMARPPRVVHFGVDRIPECGQNAEVLHAHGLSAADLASRIAAALGTRG